MRIEGRSKLSHVRSLLRGGFYDKRLQLVRMSSSAQLRPLFSVRFPIAIRLRTSARESRPTKLSRPSAKIVSMPLQDQLDAITANTRKLVQPERLAISERATADLLNSGIEARILPVGATAPILLPARRPHPQARSLCRPPRPRPAGHQLLPRPLVPLLRHRARNLARPPPRAPQARRILHRHLPPDPAPERLHPPAAWPALPPSRRRWCRTRLPVWHRLHGPSGASPLLPVHPHQHSLQQRRPQLPQRHRGKLAPSPPRRLRHRSHEHPHLRRGPRRLPRPPRARGRPRGSRLPH